MRRIGLAVLVLGLTAVPWLHADTLNVSGDAQTSSAQPNFKFGLLPLMTVRSAPSGAILNSYTQFDFSPLPEAPTVDKAVLRLWVGLVVTPGTIEVVPVLEPWQEGTISGASSPALGSPITSFAVSSGDFLHYIDVDVTTLVQDWASGYMANNGLALRGVSPGSVNVVFQGEHPDEPRAGAGGGAGGRRRRTRTNRPARASGRDGPAGSCWPDGTAGIVGSNRPLWPGGSDGATGIAGSDRPLRPGGSDGAERTVGPFGADRTCRSGRRLGPHRADRAQRADGTARDGNGARGPAVF